uniref:Uncharacterized protein n=1 Tax=Ditylenchus dipsaci TaxID=166011 RepID=A0A915E7V3_9BILA
MSIASQLVFISMFLLVSLQCFGEASWEFMPSSFMNNQLHRIGPYYYSFNNAPQPQPLPYTPPLDIIEEKRDSPDEASLGNMFNAYFSPTLKRPARGIPRGTPSNFGFQRTGGTILLG